MMELRVDCVNMFFNKPRKTLVERKSRFPQLRNHPYLKWNTDLRHSLKRRHHGEQLKERICDYRKKDHCNGEVCEQNAELTKSLEIKLEVAQRRIEVMHSRLGMLQNMLLEKLNSEMNDETVILPLASTVESNNRLKIKKELIDILEETTVKPEVKEEVDVD